MEGEFSPNHDEFGFTGDDDDIFADIKPFKEPKSYALRLKRHQDAILAMHCPNGSEGTLLVSGSADEKLRIWDMKNKSISKSIDITRPADDKLIKYQNFTRDSLPTFPGKSTITSDGMTQGERPDAL